MLLALGLSEARGERWEGVSPVSLGSCMLYLMIRALTEVSIFLLCLIIFEMRHTSPAGNFRSDFSTDSFGTSFHFAS